MADKQNFGQYREISDIVGEYIGRQNPLGALHILDNVETGKKGALYAQAALGLARQLDSDQIGEQEKGLLNQLLKYVTTQAGEYLE